MICPNLNDPEVAKKFRLLESIVPESAYYLWNKYQGEVPAKYYNLAASTPIIKEGVSELFESNSELAKIGTPAQYSQYLDSIFPNSKVKDIVYHYNSSGKKFDKFDKQFIGTQSLGSQDSEQGFSFVDNKLVARAYGSFNTEIYSLPKEVWSTLDENIYNQYDKNIISAIVNPQKGDWKINKDGWSEIMVKDPEQIHILGSKQDIEGFKSFVQNKQLVTPRQGISELFAENPQLASIGTQEQYERYLSTIFPNSKVKDIVYHGANEPIEGEKFTKRVGAIGGGIWFSGSKRYATNVMNRAPQSESLMDRKLRGAPTMYQVLLNIKNPAHFYNSSGAILAQSPERFLEGKIEDYRLHGNKQYDKNTNDGALFHHPNSKKPETSDSAEQVVVFEPEQIHILGGKQDIEGFKSFVQNKQSVISRQGIAEVFAENPQLASIGTQEQYERYLSTIFPNSKVKDIVYRGSEEEDTKLFQYWTNNRTEAYMYAKANITKGGNITERNPIPVIKNNVAEKYNLSKNILWAITDTQLGVDGLEFEGLISKDEADEARRLINTNKDIQNLQKLIELYPSVSIESESDLIKQFDDDEFIKNKPEYDKIRKELDSFFSREQVGKITIALLNIKNPYTDEIVQEDLENDRDAYKNGHDGAFLMDGDHFLVKSNTEQIHILGGKQDIEGFKKFVEQEDTMESRVLVQTIIARYLRQEISSDLVESLRNDRAFLAAQNKYQAREIVYRKILELEQSRIGGRKSIRIQGNYIFHSNNPSSRRVFTKSQLWSYAARTAGEINSRYNLFSDQQIAWAKQQPNGVTYVELDITTDFADNIIRLTDTVSEEEVRAEFELIELQESLNKERAAVAEKLIQGNELLIDGEVLPLNGEFAQRVIIEKAAISEANVEKYTNTLNKLVSRFPGVTWKWDASIPGAGKIDMNTGVVLLNPYFINDETPWHEFGHILVRGIKQTNPELFESLKREVIKLHDENPTMSAKTLVESLYPDYTGDKFWEEVITTELGRQAAEFTPKTGLFAKIQKFFTDLLASLGMYGSTPRNLNDLVKSLHDPNAEFEFFPKTPELSDYMESRLLTPEQQDAITIFVKKDVNAPNEYQSAAEQIKLITEAITDSDMGRMIERNKYFAAEELRRSESLPAAGDILNKNKGRLVSVLTKEDVAEAVLDFVEYVRYMTIYLNSIQRHIAALQNATDIPPGKKLGDYHRAYLQAQAVKKQIDALLGVVTSPDKGVFGPELRQSIEQAKSNPSLFKNHPIAKALFWMQQSVNTIISNHEGLIQEPVLQELEDYFEEASKNLKTVYDTDINNFMSRLAPENYDVSGQSLPTDANVRATSTVVTGKGTELKMQVTFSDGTQRDYSLTDFTKAFKLNSKAVERLINKAGSLQREFEQNVPTKENIRKQLKDTGSTWFAALDTASTTKNAGIQIIATYLQGLDSEYRASLVGMRGELEKLADEVFEAQGPQFAGSIVDSKTFYKGMYREVPLYEVVDGKLVTDKVVLALNNSTDTIAMRNRMTELKYIIDYSMNEIADLDPNDTSAQAQARRVEVTKKIEQASEDLREFQAQYTERPFTDEYYQIQEQLPQDIRDKRNDLYRAMAASRASFVSADTVDFDDFQLLRSYQKELDDMESFYDVNGNLKPIDSEGYRIAKAIYDWKSTRRANQVVEFPPLSQETEELFQAALNKQKAELSASLAAATTDTEKQAAYDTYNRWLDIYTRTIYKQEFYDERQAIIDQIQEILGDQGPQLKTAYESLFNLLLGKKDRDGHYKPSEINDNVRQTAKKIEEEIERIKAIDKSQSPLSKQAKDDLKYLFAELQNLQSSSNSKYYNETVDSIKASLRTQITATNPTLEVDQIEKLVNKAFRESQWFQDNHIIKSRYDKELQQMVSVYEPLYFWRVTIPNNPAYVDKEAPSFYWYTPRVSENFRNPKYSPGNITFKEATSGPYYNPSYANLSNQQKTALEQLRQFYYKSQEGNYSKDKPGDVLPGVYKTGGENAIDLVSGRANPFTNIFEETKNFVLGARTAMSDVEDTTLQEDLDAYGNPIERESRKLFIRYSKPLPIEQQSYDLLRSIGLYAESSARFKSLRNLQSTVLAMEEVYENISGVKEGGVVRDLIDRQFYGKVVNNPKNVIGKIMNAMFNVVGRLAGSKSLAFNLISAPVNQFTGYKNNLIFTKANGLNYGNYLAAYKETFGLSYDFFTSHNQTGMQPLRMQIIDFFGGTQANYSEDFTKLTNRGLRKYSRLWRAVGTYRDYTEYDIAAMTTFAFLDKYNVTADDGTIYKLKDAFELVDGVLSIKPNIQISPAFLQKIRDDIRLANYRAQGVYDKLGQPTVAKYALVRQLLFLKKWLPMHTKTEWGGSTIHYGSGIKTIGAHRAFGRFLQETFHENGKFWTGYQNLTAAERAGLEQFGLNYGMFVMFANVIGAMSVYMNCEDDGEANWKDYFCFFSKKINNEVEGVFTIWGANEFLFTYLRENANGIGGFEKLGWSLFGPFSVFRKFADFDGGLYNTDPYYKYRPNSSKVDWDRTHPTQAGKPGLQVLAMELLGARGVSLGLDPQSMDYQNRAFNSYMPKTYTKDLRTRYKENYGGVETMKTRTIGGQLKLQYKKQLKELQKKMQAYSASGQEVPQSVYEDMKDLQTRYSKAVSEMDARKDTDKTYTPSLFRPYFLTREGLDITEEF